MDDPQALFLDILKRYRGECFSMRSRIFPDPALAVDLIFMLGLAPVLESSDGYFELLPSSVRKPPKSSWRWIIAARHGESLTWTKRPDFKTYIHSGYSAEDLAARAAREPLDGLYVEDLVACPLDLSRASSRLLGLVDVVGRPLDPTRAEQPVRVWETPLAWLSHRCAGVTLVGGNAGVQQWLRRCSSDLIVSSVTMGEALITKIRRPVPAYPNILVAG